MNYLCCFCFFFFFNTKQWNIYSTRMFISFFIKRKKKKRQSCQVLLMFIHFYHCCCDVIVSRWKWIAHLIRVTSNLFYCYLSYYVSYYNIMQNLRIKMIGESCCRYLHLGQINIFRRLQKWETRADKRAKNNVKYPRNWKQKHPSVCVKV